MPMVRIHNLPDDFAEDHVKGLFARAGNVENVIITKGSQGLVEFSDEVSVQSAINLFDNKDFRTNKTSVNGRKIRVSAFRGDER